VGTHKKQLKKLNMEPSLEDDQSSDRRLSHMTKDSRGSSRQSQ